MTHDQHDVEFTRDGSVFDPDQVKALLKGCGKAGHLLVLTHGWNNDLDEAGRLYDAFLAGYTKLAGGGDEGTGVVVMRAFWPSKKFAMEQLIPGGGAASATSENETALHDALAALKQDPRRLGDEHESAARSANIDRASALVDQIEDSTDARSEFVLRIRAVLDPEEAHEDDASLEFFELEPEDLFDRFAEPVPVELVQGQGGVAALDEGGAAGFLGDLLSGPRAAARRIANYATYYQMKARAGAVGRSGMASTLTRVRDRYPDLPVHLVGHSFGGRVVVSAASLLEPGGAPVTMSLLQAAFSHNGLGTKFDGRKDGAFRAVLSEGRVTGPVVITHSKRDTAVGVAYPLASRIARDNAAALGDANDPYGGMGRNGAQHTPEVSAAEDALRPAGDGSAYSFKAGKVYNLAADELVKDHGDVTNQHVVNAVLHAMRT